MNLISVDSQKLEDACLMINMMWSCPLQVGLAIYFLYNTIGAAVFAGNKSRIQIEKWMKQAAGPLLSYVVCHGSRTWVHCLRQGFVI